MHEEQKCFAIRHDQIGEDERVAFHKGLLLFVSKLSIFDLWKHDRSQLSVMALLYSTVSVLLKQSWACWCAFHNEECKNENHKVETKIIIRKVDRSVVSDIDLNSYEKAHIYDANNP